MKLPRKILTKLNQFYEYTKETLIYLKNPRKYRKEAGTSDKNTKTA